MTTDAAALRAAIDLMLMPSLVRRARSRPLPDGMLILLSLAAGDQAATNRAVELTSRSSAALREAAAFFIEQILFIPDADSYRVLGATPEATMSELRRNMILLLKWLHPDIQLHEGRSVFARRVSSAWSDLKTPPRRAAYDDAQRLFKAKQAGSRNPERPPKAGKSLRLSKRRVRWQAGKTDGFAVYSRGGRLRRAVMLLLGGRRL